MYNEEFKKKFLELEASEHSVPVYNALFAASKKYEEENEKDMYNFTTKEIELFYYGIEKISLNSLMTYHSLILSYVDYAIEQGLRDSNINFFRSIKGTSLSRFVATYKQRFVTLEEFNEFMKFVVNDTDVAIYRSLFEGINGTAYSEFINLKIEDVFQDDEGNTFVKLTDVLTSGETTTRTISISNELYKDLHRANNQEVYYLKNGESVTNPEAEIIDSPYVFRPMARGAYEQSNGRIDHQRIYRGKILLKKLTDGQIDKTSTLSISGMMHEANEIIKEKGTLQDDDYVYLLKKFDRDIVAPTVYRKSQQARKLLAIGMKERYNYNVYSEE